MSPWRRGCIIGTKVLKHKFCKKLCTKKFCNKSFGAKVLEHKFWRKSFVTKVWNKSCAVALLPHINFNTTKGK